MCKQICRILLTLIAFVTLSTDMMAAQVCIEPPSGLVSWWPGDGNAEDIVDDNHGTLENGVIFANGMVAQAFSFDGVDDFVFIPFNTNYNFVPGGQFTIEAWVNPQRIGPGFQALVVKSPPNTEWNWGLYLNPDNTFMSGLHGLHVVNSTTVAQLGTWYHAAVTYDNGSWVLYVNGAVEATHSGTFITQSTGGLALGHKGEDVFFEDFYHGLLDEATIYNRALSASEIQAIFNAGSAGKCKDGAAIKVLIDIKPGSFPNSINPKSKGKIPVAILTTNTFDATTVDPSTVRFGSAGTKAAPVQDALEDVDEDGDSDLILHFNTQDTGIKCGDASATLVGETFGGQAVRGTDSIKTVGCK
jgi:Concanavalin A-like lectin/glucanases superfamily